MRLACCRSSLPSWRLASAENSIFHAMSPYNVFERDSSVFAAANAVERTLGKIDVLQILEVLEDRLTGIKGLGAAGALSELFEPLFDGLGKTYGQHGNLAIHV